MFQWTFWESCNHILGYFRDTFGIFVGLMKICLYVDSLDSVLADISEILRVILGIV